MKTLFRMPFLAFLCCFCAPAWLTGQHLEEVTSSAANLTTNANANVQLYWTLGELMVEYYPNGAALDQGFLQYECLIATSVDQHQYPNENAFEWVVWPNPTVNDRLQVTSSTPLQISLFNHHGQQLTTGPLPAGSIYAIDMGLYPAGSYRLMATDTSGKQRTMQVQKM